jgi:hypothetical protein
MKSLASEASRILWNIIFEKVDRKSRSDSETQRLFNRYRHEFRKTKVH